MCVEKENSSVMSSVYKVMTRIDKSKYEEWGRGREGGRERKREGRGGGREINVILCLGCVQYVHQ